MYYHGIERDMGLTQKQSMSQLQKSKNIEKTKKITIFCSPPCTPDAIKITETEQSSETA